MASIEEQLEEAQRKLAAREAQLRHALEFALQHCDAPMGSGAVLGSLATLIDDPTDAEAVEMAQTAILALVYKSPRERAAAHAWHAQQDGCKPDQQAIAIVDLARQVARTAYMYRLASAQFVTGFAAIEAFHSEYLTPRFGARSPGATELQTWFDKLDQPKSNGGLTIAGVVARIIHDGRLLGARGDDFSKTLRRVDRVLSRLANPVK